MSINEAQFSQKTELEIKNYEILKSVFNKIYEIENDLYNKRKSTFDSIGQIQESDNQTLSDIYSEFTTEMKALEEFRNNQMIKIKSKLVPATIYYSSKAKTYKQQIGKYKDKIKENEKQRQEMDKAKISRNELKQSQLTNDIQKSRNEIKTVGETLQSDVMKFEADRIVDNKYIILHFIHGELAYHAKSLEKLSNLYQKITNLKPKQHLKEFADKLNFQSVNLEEYGYDEREFTKKSINPKSSVKVSQSNKKSLKISGLGESQKSGMLKESQKDELEDENEIEDDM